MPIIQMENFKIEDDYLMFSSLGTHSTSIEMLFCTHIYIYRLYIMTAKTCNSAFMLQPDDILTVCMNFYKRTMKIFH